MFTLIRFELRYHLRRVATYVFFAVLFGLTLIAGAVAGKIADEKSGTIWANAPGGIAVYGNIVLLLGGLVVAALMGTAVYRDFELNIHELFFTTRVGKRDYLLGRFIGAFLVTLLVFSAIPLGMMASEIIGFGDKSSYGPFRWQSYASYVAIFLIPNLLILGSINFIFGAVTRNLMALYTQCVILFIGYVAAMALMGSLENRYLAAYLEPLGFGAFTLLTEYWTANEQNHRLIPFTGPLLINRALWLGVAAAVFALGYSLFRMTKDPPSWSRKRADSRQQTAALTYYPTPNAQRPTPNAQRLPAFFRLTGFYFARIVRGTPFILMTVAALALAVTVALTQDRIYDTPTYPVTRSLLENITASYGLFLLILIAFYAGELVWIERVLRVDEITDALPTPTPVLLLSKTAALALMTLTLLGLAMVTGIGVQIYEGYYRFEIGVYLSYLGITFLSLLCIVFLAVFIHAWVNQKFVGHLLIVVIGLSEIILAAFHVGRHQLMFGSSPKMTYSDMNGFGPFLAPVLWFSLYWLAIGTVLLVLAARLWARGKDDRLRVRWRRGRLGPVGTGIGWGAAVVAAGACAVTLYNTDVLNEYVSEDEGKRRQAEYEKKYKAAWENKPMPRITDVTADVDLRPEVRQFSVKGVYRLKNKTKKPIREIAVVLNPDETIHDFAFDPPAAPDAEDKKVGFRTYRLSRPLAPGQTATLKFTVAYEKRGFNNQGGRTDIAGNGTFLQEILPVIGYQRELELESYKDRKDQDLPPRPRMAPATDLAARQNTYIGNDADWITFEATVRTAPDQIALAPGYLQKEWMENGRRCFRYKMDAPIRNFYSFLSARYAVKKEAWKGKDGKNVALEVYYHPPHTFNLDRLMGGMKASLAYCSENYSPYQFRQLRIVEFPAYADLAQSFPNTIPFSEGVGFIARVRDEKADIDYPFYIAAHETAHQWWAHQVLGANVEGATMLSESLAEYTALKVLEKKYGKDRVRRFLRYDLDQYLKGRGQGDEENPLIRVHAMQQYIHYQKGALIFYALADRIGEKKLNAALARFVRDKGFQNPPYTVAPELLTYLRAVTPPDEQGFLTDSFQKITLYYLTARKAFARKLKKGKYRVTLHLEAYKYHADGSGEESEATLNDTFAIGVFGPLAKGVNARESLGNPIFLRHIQTSDEDMTISFNVDGLPARAGIDPYNVLIDRYPDDNLVDVKIVP